MSRIYIGVGSNIEREHHIKAGFQALQQVFHQCRTSTVYESEAYGFQGDPFYNLVIEAETHLPIEDVCAQLRAIEFAHGRPANAKKFSGRTLDLDLLAYDQMVCDEPLVLPRKEVLQNAFVLRPFAELVPEWVHPRVFKSLSQLWNAFDHQKQPLAAISFNWAD